MRRLLKMSVEDNSEDELDETSKEIERAVCEEMGKVVQSTSDQERPKASLSNDTELESPSLETSSSGYKTFVNVVSPLSSSTQSLTEELDSCFAELTSFVLLSVFTSSRIHLIQLTVIFQLSSTQYH